MPITLSGAFKKIVLKASCMVRNTVWWEQFKPFSVLAASIYSDHEGYVLLNYPSFAI